MSTVLQLKRSTTTSDPTLTYGELAYTNINDNNNLFIGDANNVATLIAGSTYAKTDSQIFTGTPSAPTQTQNDNSTKIATTSYVDTGLNTKQNKITSPINNDIVLTDSLGQTKDSGYSINSTNPFNNLSDTQLTDTRNIYNFVSSIVSSGNGLQPVKLYFNTNQTLSGLPTQETYTCVSGDRVICTNQTNIAENLIYIVSSGAWTVASDSIYVFNLIGAWTSITEGTYIGDYTYIVSITPTSGILVPTNVTWSSPIGQGLYQAGTGLNLTGSIFNISNTGITANPYTVNNKTLMTVNNQGQLTSASNVSLASTDLSNSANIVLQNSVNGILKGNGSTVSAASTTGTGNVVLSTNPTLTGKTIVNQFVAGGSSLGIIKAKFSGAYGFFYGLRYGYLSSRGAGKSNNGTGGTYDYSLEITNRLLCRSEINVVSDKRAKTDIEILDTTKSLELFEKIPAVSYRWNDGREDKLIKTGWLAQDVGKAGFGEAVSVIENELNGELIKDYHVLDKEQMTTLLWASCSEMLKRIKYLENKIEILENKININ